MKSEEEIKNKITKLEEEKKTILNKDRRIDINKKINTLNWVLERIPK